MAKPGVVRSLYDPTAGTGGMLIGRWRAPGQHERRCAACYVRAGAEPRVLRDLQGRHAHQRAGDRQHHLRQHAFEDGLPGKRFDYMLSNPPFGVEWKKIEKEVRKEAEQQGFNGRFGPGLPVSAMDRSLLFLMHLLSKMRPAVDGGSRFGIVLNGSPLFTGGAGSGESEIRRYMLENDLVEAIIGLPTDMFYNTGHQHLYLDRQQPQARASQRKTPTDRRRRLLAEDAQEPGEQAQGIEPRAHRGDHPAFWRVPRG